MAMTEPRSGRFVSWLVRRRRWVQGLFLLIWLDPLMLRMQTVCGPVFHCYSCPLAMFACPVGVLANFSALHMMPYLAIGTLLIVGATIGSAVCGWACPFGLLQDLAGRIPTPKVKLPDWLGYFRYAVLAGLVLAVPYLYGEAHPLFFCRVCPAGALEAAVPNAVQTAQAGAILWPSAVKLVVLVVTLVAIVFVLRPWCTVLCPLGAIFSVFNKASLLVLRFNGDRCKQCGACEKMCRYGALPAVDVNNAECIRCLECTRCQAISVGTVFGGSPKADAADVRRGPAT